MSLLTCPDAPRTRVEWTHALADRLCAPTDLKDLTLPEFLYRLMSNCSLITQIAHLVRSFHW